MSIISRVKDLEMFKEDGYCSVGVIGSKRDRVEQYMRYLCSGEDVRIRRKDYIELINETIVAGYGRPEYLIGRKFDIVIIDDACDYDLAREARLRTLCRSTTCWMYSADFNADIQDYRCETELREGVLE